MAMASACTVARWPPGKWAAPSPSRAKATAGAPPSLSNCPWNVTATPPRPRLCRRTNQLQPPHEQHPPMKQWFNHLKVSQKLMLISIFFIMPDSLMLYLYITGINENIRFARMEKKGNEYQRPLEDLLEFIPQHRLLAHLALDGQPPALEWMKQKQGQIDAAFDALEAVDARIGRSLQFTQEGLAKRQRG